MTRGTRVGGRGTLTIAPAPLLNPRAYLDGAWIVRRCEDGRVVARFATDGRDRAEAYVVRRMREGER